MDTLLVLFNLIQFTGKQTFSKSFEMYSLHIYGKLSQLTTVHNSPWTTVDNNLCTNRDETYKSEVDFPPGVITCEMWGIYRVYLLLQVNIAGKRGMVCCESLADLVGAHPACMPVRVPILLF